MSGTLAPASPTAAWVDETGISAPTFNEIRDYLVGQFQVIYGDDIVTTPDTQDGQLIGVFALALADVNAACIRVYNQFSPSTSQGVGLSSMVKINGMLRALPSHSSVLLTLVGEAGREIVNGAAMSEGTSNKWILPPSVVFPPSGLIEVTAIAENPGDIMALPHTVTRIATVTLGWQTVTNNLPAVTGAPVESDAALRLRQSQSTAMPSLTVLGGITGAVLALDGVTACKPYENDTNVVQVDTTLPPHSIAMVVVGGDAQEICQTILMHKTPGCFTYGTVRETVYDNYLLPHDIGFFIPTPVTIKVNISIKVNMGYTSRIGAMISQSVVDYIEGLGSGESIIWSKLWLPANLCDQQGTALSVAGDSYDIVSLTVAKDAGAFGVVNIPLSIFEIATCVVTDVIVTVAP
jgi:uncharacterized phage protein gp47/JayE